MIDCILLSTPKRIEWLKKSVDSIDLLNFKFNKKIISVDIIDQDWIEDSVVEYFKNKGWIVDVVSFKSKHLSFKHALEISKSEYIFYTEDDIIIDYIPENINDILKIDFNNKKCGILSFNLGGSLLRYPHAFGDMDSIEERIVYKKDNEISFIRDINKKNNFFVEFPAMFIHNDIIKNLLSGPQIDNQNIELNLSSRYFSNNYHNYYFKQCMCYDKILEVMDYLNKNRNLPVHDADIMMEGCKFYKLLDPNQGGYLGGLDLKKINYIKK